MSEAGFAAENKMIHRIILRAECREPCERPEEARA
jgi:hypothetical protein